MRRLITYRADTAWRPAVEIDGEVVDLEQAGWPFDGQPRSVRTVLSAGIDGIDRAVELAASAVERGRVESHAVGDVELGPPITDPIKIMCLGVNYQAHVDEAAWKTPDHPVVFAKFANVLVGPRASIPLNRMTSEVDWEGELVAVIGRRCKHVAVEDALGVVAGYCAFNDVSARDLQLQGSQWTVGKSLDGFGPLGPGIVPASDVTDPLELDLTTRLNGEVVQSANTSQMIVDIPHAIAYLSSVITLEPGDLLATGTSSGVGMYRNPPRFMRAGDVIEVEIEQIGSISNTIVPDPDVEP